MVGDAARAPVEALAVFGEVFVRGVARDLGGHLPRLALAEEPEARIDVVAGADEIAHVESLELRLGDFLGRHFVAHLEAGVFPRAHRERRVLRIELAVVAAEVGTRPFGPFARGGVDHALHVLAVHAGIEEHQLAVGRKRDVRAVADAAALLGNELGGHGTEQDVLLGIHEEVAAMDAVLVRVPHLVGHRIDERNAAAGLQMDHLVLEEVDHHLVARNADALAVLLRREFVVTDAEDEETAVVGHGLRGEVGGLLVEGDGAGLDEVRHHARLGIHELHEQLGGCGRLHAGGDVRIVGRLGRLGATLRRACGRLRRTGKNHR